jgi:mono/diheme cytochrome c family protein
VQHRAADHPKLTKEDVMKTGAALMVFAVALAGAAHAEERLDPKKLKAPKVTPELLEQGKQVYAVNCVPCHGEKGDGNGPAAAALTPKPRDFGKEPFKQGELPAEVFVTLTYGVKDTPMVPFAHLSEDERWALSHFVLSLKPPPPPPSKDAKKPKKAAP